MPECLTDEFLAQLLDGRLAAEERALMHGHIDTCPACHGLVAVLVQEGSSPEVRGMPLPEGPLSLPREETSTGSSLPGWTPPTEFNEFQLVRPLGCGAMGIVYLARDRSLGRPVAVKFIASHQPGSQVRERFRNEARAIAQLQHPNVVTVFRIGEVEGHPFIVSEYLEGQTLARLPLPLPWRHVLELGIGLARGLAEAHRQGVLHRDIKPSNILLTQGGEVKLLDFGLAEFVTSGTGEGTHAARTVAGTPRYMAPELFKGLPATPRSDLYALGLVLHELCTGKLPPWRRGADGAVPPLTERVRGMDPHFAALIERCLQADPGERYASAGELCTALEQLHVEDAAQRALRQRLDVAIADWERLERAEELLWRKRQLDEAGMLDTALLGTREQDFLRASQRAVRRQALRRGLAAGFMVLVVVVLTGGPRLQEYWETQRLVSERMAAAEKALAMGRYRSQRAITAHERALTLFKGQDPDRLGMKSDHEALWSSAEAAWAQALQELEQADVAYAEAEGALEEVQERVNPPEAREFRIQLTYERILLAEAFHRKGDRARLVQDFERLTVRDAAWRERLNTSAELEIQTTPPGARVELTQYVEDEQGEQQQVPVPGFESLGMAPVARLSLPAGSYHLRFTREGHPPIDLPLLLERGETEQVHLDLPSQVLKGYVYIPPGPFLMGSADAEEVREFMHSTPLHEASVEQGYLIGKTEVTLGQWMEYLDTLPAGDPDRHLLKKPRPSVAGALKLEPLPGKGWGFSLIRPDGKTSITARSGEPFRYPGRLHRQEQRWERFPLSGVSVRELSRFLAWLNSTGRLPGARLCTEPEWVRAARGADDRRHPHGNRLLKDDANIDMTYDRKPDNFGPDEVEAHPASKSPFEVHGMVGNAFEITQAPIEDLGKYVILGGAWYFERIGTFIPNRQAFTDEAQDATVGVRLCASWSAR